MGLGWDNRIVCYKHDAPMGLENKLEKSNDTRHHRQPQRKAD